MPAIEERKVPWKIAVALDIEPHELLKPGHV